MRNDLKFLHANFLVWEATEIKFKFNLHWICLRNTYLRPQALLHYETSGPNLLSSYNTNK